MINGIGVVGWGVGGIEAEAGMLGQPVYFLTPDVVGVELTGKLNEGITATDLVLTVTEMLRKEKVVGKFVEFFGEGTASLAVPDRATIANMAPEYGATMGFFPVDDATVDYLTATGRTAAEIDAFASYFKAQGLYGDSARRRHRLHEGAEARPLVDQGVGRRARSARRTASSSATSSRRSPSSSRAGRRERLRAARRKALPPQCDREGRRRGQVRSDSATATC